MSGFAASILLWASCKQNYATKCHTFCIQFLFLYPVQDSLLAHIWSLLYPGKESYTSAVMTLLLFDLVTAVSEKRGKILQNYWKSPCVEAVQGSFGEGCSFQYFCAQHLLGMQNYTEKLQKIGCLVQSMVLHYKKCTGTTVLLRKVHMQSKFPWIPLKLVVRNTKSFGPFIASRPTKIYQSDFFKPTPWRCIIHLKFVLTEAFNSLPKTWRT